MEAGAYLFRSVDEKQIKRKSDADGNSSDMGDCLCSTEIGYGSDKPDRIQWDKDSGWCFRIDTRDHGHGKR